MELIYGVDSAAPATTRLTNGYNLYDWVMRKSCYPSFWGRDITGDRAITVSEAEFLKSKNCKIPLIIRDLTEAEISGKRDAGIAMRAVEAAMALGVPQNQGIALFAYIPPTWSVNHNWMIHYARILMANGFIPGFMGNTDSSRNFNFGRQCSHYVQATAEEDQLHAVYWSRAPKYEFDPEVWAPYAPSELLPKDMHLWNYGRVDFHSLRANKSYIRDISVMKCFF